MRSYPSKTFKARIAAWDPLLDANTRNVTIRAVVDNKLRQLAPGMFAEMEVTSTQRMTVLTVPETAIFYNIYGEAVYVLEKPEATKEDSNPDFRLAARQVNVAYRSNGIAGVSQGIKAGDQVVTAGQLKLYPSLKVAIVDDVPDYQPSTDTAQ